MTPVKRIEVVADSLHLPDVVRVLEAHGVSGYTIIRDVTGRGHRGKRRGDELTGVFQNSYVMTACAPDVVPALAQALRPIISRIGGIVLISDAVLA